MSADCDAPDITVLLRRIAAGDRDAEPRLLDLVYAELRRLAGSYMRRERPDHTLQPSALVNEAYVRMIGSAPVTCESRAHFFVTAAQTMRRVLIDYARTRQATKRAGAVRRVEFDEALALIEEEPSRFLDLDVALTRLAELDERQARIVELRFFAGLTVEETAEIMGISPKTVKRDWAMTRAWLETQLGPA